MAAAAPGEPPPGTVKVNSVPGKPGTIGLEYSGGPITIALDTQAFSQQPTTPTQEPAGEFFYDSAGNKYPVSLITALQKAGLLNTAPPITTSQAATQSDDVTKQRRMVDKASVRNSSLVLKPSRSWFFLESVARFMFVCISF